MVLAKKKLKQQLRSLLAVSVEAAESRKPSKAANAAASAGAEDVNQRLQSLRELLVSKNRRDNRPTRRGGRKRRRTSTGDSKPAAEAAAEGGEAAGSPAGSSKGKKRKRAGDGAAESSEQDQGSNVKGKEEEKKNKKKKAEKNKKNKRNKKRKSSQKKNAEEDKEGTKTCSSSEKKAVETATIDARDENGDAGRKVYVGGIPYYSTEDDIRSFFEGCGTVSEVDCMMFPESGKFRGIAILTFKTEAAAKRAMALDGSDMGGLYLKIQPYKAAPPPPPPTRQRSDVFSPEIIDGYNRIYVGNLAWDITEEDLRAFFQGCSISAVRFGEDKATGEFKGYAHVDFHDGASLAAALKLDQAELCGRPAKISCAVPTKKVVAAPKPAAVGGKRGTTVPAAAAGGGGGKKKKRQTCYECGVPGHLSSDCPQKKPAVVAAR